MFLDLAGPFDLIKDGQEKTAGHLPGSIYLDYMAAGMPDPFFGLNEKTAHDLGHHRYTYERSFALEKELLNKEHIEFVCDGADTVGEIYINGVLAGRTANSHRTYRFDVKDLLREGENSLRLELADPYEYIAQEALKHPDFPSNDGKNRFRYIRKPACHFGWDWGPELCPSGVLRSLYLDAFDARIDDVRVLQRHSGGRVSLDVETTVSGAAEDMLCRVSLSRPNGETAFVEAAPAEEKRTARIPVEHPQLWWPNGLGEQPLYTLTVQLIRKGETDGGAEQVEYELTKRLGLRTIELDRSADADGEQFRFVVNGVPIFAKGADWIPPDQFVTRFTREDMEFYLSESAKAHFNMLRVWGGGSYESEDFYDMCDQYGILVWQDFMFACNLYPFDDEAFLENCREEVRDNVRRLRHRASLALWCGNNEIEALQLLIKKPIMQANMEFFHKTLPEWVSEDDPVTPYWPGSPSSGHIDRKLHNFKKGQLSGDSHLWNIWHGMLPIEKFSGFPTRFCSEFGMESMPLLKTVKRFHPQERPELFDEVMQQHQKSGGGNAKILYYLLAKYKAPKSFEDFIYLSQLVQADTVRYATECWKRNIGRQNGALFWQFNDTWPVASWASIDYYKQLKAVQYRARHFNKLLMVSNDYHKDRFELYVINEYPEEKTVRMAIELKDFYGAVKDHREYGLTLGGVSSALAASYRFDAVLKKAQRKDHYIKVSLYEEELLKDEKTYLLVEDKKAELPKDPISLNLRQEGTDAVISLRSGAFKRSVYLDSDLVWAPWSDNFIDLEPGTEREVRVALNGTDAESLKSALTVKDLSSVDTENSPVKNKLLRAKMFLKDKNWLTYVLYKLILS